MTAIQDENVGSGDGDDSSRPKGDDPATTLESDRDPATSLNAGGQSDERQGDVPPTDLESGREPPTDDRPPRRRTRVPIPPELEGRYEAIRDLGTQGAEADVVLARVIDSGELRVVKVYRRPRQELDEDRIESVRGADPDHMVQVIEAGGDDPYWELLEYYELGSLVDLIQATSGKPAAERAELAVAVATEVAAGLQYLHSELGLIHRDVKPANLLVRGEHPLDLVLADLGLLTEMEGTLMHHGTTRRTFAYAAPETAAGILHRTSDWWSLGMIVAEILGGRHPFAPGGHMMSDLQVSGHLAMGRPVDLSAVLEAADDRLLLLCRGLLVQDPAHRWSAAEVQSWLAGERPQVHEDVSAMHRPARLLVSFPFRDPDTGAEREFDDPVELAGALAADWDAAAELVEGRDRRRRQMLRDFLLSAGVDDAEAILGLDDPPEAILVRVLVALDDEIEPVFRGRVLDHEGLRQLAVDATSGGSAADALGVIYDGRILRAYTRPETERDDYASLDTAWQRSSARLETGLKTVSGIIPSQAVPDILAAARARILEALLDSAAMLDLQDQGAGARNDAEALAQMWFRELADHDSDEGEASDLVLLILLRDEAVAATREVIDRERQAELAQANARERAKRRVLLRIAWLALQGLTLGVMAWLPWAVAVSLFHWEGIGLPVFVLCAVGGIVGVVASGSDDWRRDLRAWRSPAANGPVPSDPVATVAPFRSNLGGVIWASLVILAVVGVFKGCGAIVSHIHPSTPQQAHRHHAHRHHGGAR